MKRQKCRYWPPADKASAKKSRMFPFLLMIMMFISFDIFAQNVQITGNVFMQKDKEVIIGANVLIEGTSVGTITDIDGNFTLNVPQNSTIVVSYIGCETRKIKVGNHKNFTIAMTDNAVGLDDVVVVGFGTQKKVNLTGAVASVSKETFANKPVANLGQALQGVVPNLNVSTSNGGPNSTPQFNVRGGTSVSLSNNKWVVENGSPLILVDGIEMGEGFLNMMNPEDIENITVLKDAAASAIYGARAAYGVMLVTTKSGANNQKTKVGYSMNMQWNTPSHIPDILDSYTYQLAANQATVMTQGTVSPWAEKLLEAKKKYIENPTSENAWIYNEGSDKAFTWVANVNPYDLAVRDWTPMQKHTFNISGGSDKTRYYASVGYQSQEGMYKINTDEQRRYNGLFSLDTEVAKWFSIGTKVSYNVSSYDEPYMNSQKGSLWSAMKNEPQKNINSPIKTSLSDPLPGVWTDNIVGWIAYGATQERQNTSALFNLNPTITIIPELKLKGEFAYRPSDYYLKRVIPTREYVVDNWQTMIKTHTDPSSVFEQVSHSDLFTINAYMDFNKTFSDKHALSGVLGYNQEWYNYRYTEAKGEGILTNQIPVINLTTGNQYAGDALSHWAIRGAFLRLNYSYASRYLLEFNGRYDGTSRFPTDSRFKFFPSVSAGWRVSEEAFMNSTRGWLDNLKVRASWGSLGNQNVDNYAYIPQYGSANYVPFIMGDTRPMGISAPGLISPNLTWETAGTVDLGLDFTLLRNRLDFSFDWYERRTTDILVTGDKFPAVLGTSAPKKNSGELKTNGWELSLKWRDNLSNGLRYDVGFVLSDYITEVVKFDGNPNRLLSSLYGGMKMGEIWGYETVGILQETDFTKDANGKYILTGPSQSKLSSSWYPGDIRYADIGGKIDEEGNAKDENGNNLSTGADGEISTGDNTVANPGDRKIIGNSTPRLSFGVTGNLAWKGFDLNVFFQGIANRDVWISDNAYWGASGAGNWEVYKNSWTPENTNAKYPMYASRGQNQQVQTGYLINGAFIRLKTLTLGYTIPKVVTSKLNLDRVRLNVSGFNLFELTQIPNTFDPELISSDYPMMRSVALGVQIDF